LGVPELERGKAAHRIITAYYQDEHPGNWVDGNIKPWRGGKRWLPDIINFTTKTMAEIKSTTPSEVLKGAAKLVGYLSAANAATLAGSRTWGPDLWFPLPIHVFFWLGAVDPLFSDWYGVIVGNLGGVITYQLHEISPTAPAPIPVPVTQAVTETKRVLSNRLSLEDELIAAHLAAAAKFVLYGSALVLGGMVLVNAANSMRGIPRLYQGARFGSGGSFGGAFGGFALT